VKIIDKPNATPKASQRDNLGMDVIAAAELAGVLEKETDDGPAKGSKASGTLHIKV
jgi:hypothetical protein